MSPNVAELVNELHAEAHRGAAALLTRYVELVQQAGRGTLTPEQAAEAARLAYEMEMPADRFERDLAVVRRQQAIAEQIEADQQAAQTFRERHEAMKAKVDALQKELNATTLAWQRMRGEIYERQVRRDELAKTTADHPHLFADAATLTDAQWRALRK